MRNWALAAAAITAVLALATPAKNAAAVPIATPGQLGLAQGAAASVEKTVLVCGPWGCYWRPGYWGWYRPYPYPYPYPYWGWRRHYWWGWHRPWGWHRGWHHGWHRHWGWPLVTHPVTGRA